MDEQRRIGSDPDEPTVVAVIGGGLMGHAIAQEFALGGLDVRLCDRTEEVLSGAVRAMAVDLDALVRAGIVDGDRIAPAMARVRTTPNLAEAVTGADLVVEAVSEDLALKRRLFAEMDELCPAGVILASNTSSYMPSLLAGAVRRPERLLVTHYFNPAHLLPLVEVVPNPQTAPGVVDRVVRLLARIGKTPVVVRKEAPGFVGNRLQMAILREAMAIVEAGIATPADVDAVVTAGFGRRLGVAGPFAIADMAGLDVNLRVMEELLPSMAAGSDPPRMLQDAVATGRLGTKSLAGIYEWTEASARAAREQVGTALLNAPSPIRGEAADAIGDEATGGEPQRGVAGRGIS